MRGRSGGRASIRSSMKRADLRPESEEKEMSTCDGVCAAVAC